MLVTKIVPPNATALSSYQVGDVTERYRSTGVATLLDQMGKEVLEKYRQKEGTWKTGGRRYDTTQAVEPPF